MEADGEPEYQPTPKGRRTTMGRRPAAAALPHPYELEEAQPMVEDMNAGGAAWEHFLEQQLACRIAWSQAKQGESVVVAKSSAAFLE